MSLMTRAGEQVDPGDLRGSPLPPEDTWVVAGAVLRDESLSEDERRRLFWAVMETSAPSMLGDDR